MTTCSSCQADLAPDSRFCSKCGATVRSTSQSSARGDAPPAPPPLPIAAAAPTTPQLSACADTPAVPPPPKLTQPAATQQAPPPAEPPPEEPTSPSRSRLAATVLLGAVGVFLVGIIVVGVSILGGDPPQETADRPPGTETTSPPEETTTTVTKLEPPNPVFASTFGMACSEFPVEGPGSLEGMSNERSIIAMSNNPLMSEMAELADASMFNTMFDDRTLLVPYNAWLEGHSLAEEWRSGERDVALDLPTTLLENVITAQDLIDAGQTTPITGSGRDVTTDGETMMIGDATVLCGNIKTSQGVLFLLDSAPA